MVKTSYFTSPTKIKVIGLGGAGCNAITRMVHEHIPGVEFIAMDTDSKHLAVTEAPVRIQIGERTTYGLGAGGDHEIGRKVAEDSRSEIKQVVAGADFVFIAAGMGGGTGTGSAPLVAEIAKDGGALTLAMVTKPFSFEGTHRSRIAKEGMANMINKVDTLITVPNDRLFDPGDNEASIGNIFKIADEVLLRAVQAISGVIVVPGLINLDFADIRAVMKDAGAAWMSIGRGFGKNRARDAAREALSSPLLDVPINRAKRVLFNVAGGSDLTLFEVNDAAMIIQQAADPGANVVFGVSVDSGIGNEVRLTIIATGFDFRRTPRDFKEKEITRPVKPSINETELDIPAFLRRSGSTDKGVSGHYRG
ncbi:MAG: cell division protein FtsZ [Dehalococcoidia bacterium]|jgi:cell division protein FtsZ|nr:MAG: cell division protein FtsZ [Dehalococcoidia bacterium]